MKYYRSPQKITFKIFEFCNKIFEYYDNVYVKNTYYKTTVTFSNVLNLGVKTHSNTNKKIFCKIDLVLYYIYWLLYMNFNKIYKCSEFKSGTDRHRDRHTLFK